MYQLIRSIELIGYYQNWFIVDFLCIWVSPFDFILLPDNWLPGYDKTKTQKDWFGKAGYKVKVSLFFIGILIGQFLITFIALAAIALITLLIIQSVCWLGRNKIFINLRSKIIGFCFKAYPLRFIVENFLIMFGTFALNFNLYWNGYEDQNEINKSNTDKISFLCISAALILAYILGVLTLLILSIWQIGIPNPWCNLLAFVKGLNISKLNSVWWYFGHFFGIWLYVVALMLLTPEMKHSYVFSVLLFGAQIFAIVLHFSRFYVGIVHNLLAILREF